MIAASGRPVRITDAATVRASHERRHRPRRRCRHPAVPQRPGYFGPASLSFTVTDGEVRRRPRGAHGHDRDPDRRALRPRISRPRSPAASSTSSPAVEDDRPGQAHELPDPRAVRSSDSACCEAAPTASAGARRRRPARAGRGVDAEAGARQRSASRMPRRVEGVPDASSCASSRRRGRSPSPLPTWPSLRADERRPIDVLANDAAGNPFPATPLRVVGVRGLDDGSLPPGVTITPSADRSRLAVAVSTGAEPINTTIQYQVADATGDPSRYAWGTVTISVQDRPDPVADARITGFRDGTLDVAFGAGGVTTRPSQATGSRCSTPPPATRSRSAECVATTCTVSTPGNGPGAAVDVSMRALQRHRTLRPRGCARPDVVRRDPAARGRACARCRSTAGSAWNGRRSDGIRQRRPVVRGHGRGSSVEVPASTACTASLCAIESQASRTAAPSRSRSARATARSRRSPSGPRRARRAPRSVPPFAGDIAVSADAAAGSVVVSWSPFGGNGDAIAGYFVERLVEGESGVPAAPRRARSLAGAGHGGGAAERRHRRRGRAGRSGCRERAVHGHHHRVDAKYSFIVWGYNRAGCVQHRGRGHGRAPAPGAVAGVRSRWTWLNVETWDRYIDDVDSRDAAPADHRGRCERGADRLAEGLPRLGVAPPAAQPALRRDGPLPGARVLGVGLVRDRGRRRCRPGVAVADLRTARRAWDAATATWSWTAAPANNGLPADLPVRRRRRPRRPGRAVGDVVPGQRRQGRRPGLVGC